MIPRLRKQFNEAFSQEKYHQLIQSLEQKSGQKLGFRQSESPIFLTYDFKYKLNDVCTSIIHQFKKISTQELQQAIPPHLYVPNDTKQPHFLAIDFGICKDEEGCVVPQLIELQAFPTLFAYQEEYENAICELYPFLKSLQSGIKREAYFDYLRAVIVGDENPENVVLLEIYPELQKTNVDFYFTEKHLGISIVCITKVKKQGKKLYYESNGKQIEIKRIYNRVIFDELLQTKNLKMEFDFMEDLEVTWVTHPNWFFKISKFLLPKLQHPYIPKSYFLNDFPNAQQVSDFVLKPLFSFAGSGVNLSPNKQTIEAIEDKENYILQRKVKYEPFFQDINGEYSKAEIRMFYVWKDNEPEPQLMDNLVRMTKADMVNVNFNKKDAIWIGSSIAFFGD